MKAGESVCASLLVSFRLIPQVNASTYLQPRTISLAFPLSCSAPACRCFYGSGEESSGGVKEGRHSVVAGSHIFKGKDGAEALCHNLTL